MTNRGIYWPIMGWLVNGSELAPETIIPTPNASAGAPSLLSGYNSGVLLPGAATAAAPTEAAGVWGVGGGLSHPVARLDDAGSCFLVNLDLSLTHLHPLWPMGCGGGEAEVGEGFTGGLLAHLTETSLSSTSSPSSPHMHANTSTSQDPRRHMRLRSWQQACECMKACVKQSITKHPDHCQKM